jgi:putative membrane protein
MKQQMFSQTDLDRITEAVRLAESKTSGEIVPYFVERSDNYAVASWRSGAILASVALLASLVIHAFSKSWLPFGPLELSGIVVGAFFLGFILARILPAYKRSLLGHHLIDLRVSQSASLAFLSEEVFKTRERTGILIFMSLFERRVIVLGDSGINSKVAKTDWDDIVKTIVKSIREHRVTDGIVEAISQCGELLQKHGIKRRRDDTDELSDTLRVG